MAYKILVVEDEPSIRELLADLLRSNEFEVVESADGVSAVTTFLREKPDVVLLDVMLPGKDGLQVCREINAMFDDPKKVPPIIFLSAKDSDEDRIKGLELGSYDYETKPWNNAILLQKIKNAIVRTAGGKNFKIGPLTLDVLGHEVRRGEERVSLTPLEFELLLALAKEPYRVFKREDLLEEVWGIHHYKADTRLVNVHIQRLRSKIEEDPDNPKIVTTVRGVGYKAGQG
ncbi:MAG: hypothetical protein RL556_84 [Actinomycetota bacterium]|jgi:two-component system response regulator MtrA